MVSAFNFSLTFAVICALLGSSSASLPPAEVTPEAAVQEVAPEGVTTVPIEAALQLIINQQMETLFRGPSQNLVETLELMFHCLQQLEIADSASKEGIAQLAPWTLDLVLRLEMFMIADNSHYMFPRCGNADLESWYKIIAVAASKLSRNLKTMKRADMLITEASDEMMDKSGLRVPVKADQKAIDEHMETFLHKYFQTLNDLFMGDSKVGAEYRKEVAIATEFVKVNPKVRDAFFYIGSVKQKERPSLPEIDNFLQDKFFFRQTVVSQLFLKQLEPNWCRSLLELALEHNGFWDFNIYMKLTEFKSFLMVNALIRKAASNDSGAGKIDEIYQQALSKAGEMPVNEKYLVIAKTLLAAIEKGLESEPKLQREIRVLMKQIEEKTLKYAKILQLDFPPV